MEPSLLESLQQSLNNLPPELMEFFDLDLSPSDTDDDCRNPPSDEALLLTATPMAHMMRSVDSSKHLYLRRAPASVLGDVLTAGMCSSRFVSSGCIRTITVFPHVDSTGLYSLS